MISDEEYMGLALDLAKKGHPSPNPKVGCVIVKNQKVVGKGFHRFFGDHHAEVHALMQAGKKAKNSTAYVTLDPCCHHGKTPPCTTALIKAGVKKVIVYNHDPNVFVKGKGINSLKKATIKVKTGVLAEKCQRLNEAYFKYVTTKKPFVVLKAAISLDGKIATSTGESKYLSGKEALAFVHNLRNENDAILVGINTVLQDDPKLLCRTKRGHDPFRVILDSTLKIPWDAKVLNDSNVIIATTTKADKKKLAVLKKKGIEVFIAKSKHGRVDINHLMDFLGNKSITSILVEGGSTVFALFIKEKLADKLLVIITPKIIGGNGIPVIKNLGIKELSEAVNVSIREIKKIGKDFLIEAYPK